MSELIRTPLARYLAGARRRFVYGEHDCFLFAADWIVAQGWPDPAAAYRGAYASQFPGGQRRIVRRAGGVLALARETCAAVGLPEIDAGAAVAGDVAVGHTGPGPHAWRGEPVCLIKAGDFWATLTANAGVVLGPAEILAAWSV